MDFFYTVNETWKQLYYQENSLYGTLLVLFTLLSYVATLVLLVVAILYENMLISLFFFVLICFMTYLPFSEVNPKGSIFVSGLISFYCLCWAILGMDNSKNTLETSYYDYVFSMLALTLT